MTPLLTNHISVCICTYKRPDMLQRLLVSLAAQDTQGKFTFSVVVADNDGQQSALAVVEAFRQTSPVPVTYCVEPRQNIALVRNRAVAEACGDYITFIDDDEFTLPQWLLTLHTTCNERDVDGVLGPVKPHYDVAPPRWVIDGKFYDRPSYPTGMVIDWRKGRTGNTMIRRRVFAGMDAPFREEFGGGAEDQDFFRRVIDKGFVFVWCHEALAYEVVPAIRWKLSVMIRRALLRGNMALNHPTTGPADILKSAVAAVGYLLVLPFSVLFGQHRFMNCLIKMFDHAGKVLGAVGLNPAQKYVTQ
ncbi:MAG TPA: glycosyltransferase family A protein [Candidatus Saccharimonadales bacterium]|jgi:glycosyltransferase involved in cell wall biosynthesis|nr:glycosyltransferase family A protein [Candidatus Saccharimonadales bacterium]